VSLLGARRHPRTAALPVEGHLPGFDVATLACVRAWAAKYRDRGLVVIGVHTPEGALGLLGVP
jgi:hypothetical protein